MVESPILLDEEQDKEKSPITTTSVSERPTRSRMLMRNRRFGTRNENIPDYVWRNLRE